MLADDSWAPPVHSPLLSQHTGMPILPSSSKDKTSDNFKDNEKLISTQEKEEYNRKVTDEDNNMNCKTKHVENEFSVHGDYLTCEPRTSKNNDENNENQNKGVSDEEEEEWKERSLSDYIPEGQFLFLPPSRYCILAIFF